MSAEKPDKLQRLIGDVEHFRVRVLQDALAEATATYWRRRAEAFEAARPRPGDFTGAATAADLRARDAELAAKAQACLARAAVSLADGGRGVPPAPPRIVCAVCDTPTSPWTCSCGHTRTGGAA